MDSPFQGKNMNENSKAIKEFLLKHLIWGREPDDFGNADSHILDRFWSCYRIDPKEIPKSVTT